MKERDILRELTTIPLIELINDHPYIKDFFSQLSIINFDTSKSCEEIVCELTDEFLLSKAIERQNILASFNHFVEEMRLLNIDNRAVLSSITIIGGIDKIGCKENFTLTMHPGEIISIVGPTGSGKSRLLEDIECLAQKDTPTKRQILVNNQIPSQEKRFSMQNKLVAQLSQNMNFIMDLTVEEFITMHAESRMIKNVDSMVKAIIECANSLAGEDFTLNTPVTQLSGGQSRALMIADTALLSTSPIILIDEIENAGIDRKKSLELLVKEEKIVIMSTHNPILALMGDKRLVIKNGGIDKIIETSSQEKSNLEKLQIIDCKMLDLRNELRRGGTIDLNISEYF